MRFRTALLVIALALVSACGASSEGDAKVDASLGGAFDSKECAAAVSGLSKVTAAFPSAMSGKSGALDDAVKEFDTFAAAAPKEIRADVKVLAVAFGKAVKVLAEASFDPSSGSAPTKEQLEALQSIGSSLDTAETKAAGERVTAFFEKECGTTP